ncbi:MAG TPA: hypothetical protein VMU48_07665 [Terracidiphilus sp.]|nr:hypothetical protein [Terracidiphilus sp.]
MKGNEGTILAASILMLTLGAFPHRDSAAADTYLWFPSIATTTPTQFNL